MMKDDQSLSVHEANIVTIVVLTTNDILYTLICLYIYLSIDKHINIFIYMQIYLASQYY